MLCEFYIHKKQTNKQTNRTKQSKKSDMEPARQRHLLTSLSIHVGVSRTHMAEEEHWLLKIVFWPPHVPHGVCTPPYTKYKMVQNQIFLKLMHRNKLHKIMWFQVYINCAMFNSVKYIFPQSSIIYL